MLKAAARTVFANARTVLGALIHRPEHFCIICERRVLAFLPYKGGNACAPAVTFSADIVGSDLDNFSCPRCKSTDRERHLLLYMRQLGVFEQLPKARILHFAPERKLSELIRLQQPAHYVRGDLFPTQADITRLDMEAIDVPDASFDLIIANHVLEHVSDDLRALSELYRALASGGRAILQTPYSASNKLTQQDPEQAIDDKARLELYGQEDHVRLFGSDIVERICSAVSQDLPVQALMLLQDEHLSVLHPTGRRGFFRYCYSFPLQHYLLKSVQHQQH